jgi:RNA polymerase sigma factor (sigma-70 family)
MLRRDPFANTDRLIRRIYSYVAYRIGDGADAEDVTSAVFERALQYRDSYDARRGEPISWLIGIARREINSFLASRPVLTTGHVEQPDLHDRTANADARLDLAAALRRLDERDQEVLALRYGSDLTAREIGALLGKKPNAVEVMIHRALERLRRELEPAETPQEAPVFRTAAAP